MQQPKWEAPVEDLQEHLRFAVPLRAAALAHQISTQGYTRDEATRWLTGEARRAGSALGQGDILLFCDGSERTGRARAAAIRTTDDLVTGIAAAALLAQLDGSGGVTAFGDYHGVAPQTELPAADSSDVHRLLD
ncbi:hypothetical protein, partial [Streptomyces violaceus]